jgi:hypothetical protein
MRAKTFLLAAIAVCCLIVSQAEKACAKYEEPKYAVSLQEGNFEVRQYPPLIFAIVDIPAVGRDGASEAYRILAGYIFGQNKSCQSQPANNSFWPHDGSEKIAMTVPVTIEDSVHKLARTVPVEELAAEDKHLKMRLFIPEKYSVETLPAPSDKRVQFESVPARRYAVIRYSGLAQGSNLDEHIEKLRRLVKEHNLEPDGEPLVAYYNPPWTLPFMRRNEIWIPLGK